MSFAALTTGCIAIYVPNVDQAVEHRACHLLDDWIGHNLRMDVRMTAWQVQLQVQVSVICPHTRAQNAHAGQQQRAEKVPP